MPARFEEALELAFRRMWEAGLTDTHTHPDLAQRNALAAQAAMISTSSGLWLVIAGLAATSAYSSVTRAVAAHSHKAVSRHAARFAPPRASLG